MARTADKTSAMPKTAPLTPHLCVSPADEAIKFYEKAFGATLLFRADTPDGRRILHASMQLPNGGTFFLNDDFPEFTGGTKSSPQALGGSPVTLHVDTPDVDAVYKRVVDAGAKVEMPLDDQFWGDRYGSVIDPFGHRWSIATHKRDVSEEEVSEAAKEMFK